MSYLRDGALVQESTVSSPATALAFAPNLFRAQNLRPRIQEAVSGLVAALVLADGPLTRIQKESIMLCAAGAYRSVYCITARRQSLHSLGLPWDHIDQLLADHSRSDLSGADVALLSFARKLATHGISLSAKDVDVVRRHGFSDDAILQAILATALTHFLCTLAAGLGPAPDFEPTAVRRPESNTSVYSDDTSVHREPGPYLHNLDLRPEAFPAFLLERFQFVPNIFRAQALRMDLIEAEVDAVRKILQPEDALSAVRKELILLVASAVNLNTYCVAAHCEVLRLAGVSTDESDQIALDHHHANLSDSDKTLLDFVVKLTARPWEISRNDIDSVRRVGFSEEQVLEAVAVTGLNNFFNTLQMGLGTTPDVEPLRTFGPEDVHVLAQADARPAVDALVDEDLELVVRVQNGDVDAFGELIERHSRRIYRTVVAILGNTDEAEDVMQEAFLKAFQHIRDFRRRSKFSTWLTRIAGNSAVQRLRDRVPTESIDEQPDDRDNFRPRQIRTWDDNPEQLYSKAERRALVEAGLMKLPVKYRVVVVLRDIEQLSGEEAAAALGIGLPALKSRLLRGRLMLREALAPHYSVRAERTGL